MVKTPAVGSFMLCDGRKATIHAATFAQVYNIAGAESSKEMMTTSKEILDTCVEIEGSEEAPSSILTISEAKKAVEMAQSVGEADFT